jgi:hypothetical protein
MIMRLFRIIALAIISLMSVAACSEAVQDSNLPLQTRTIEATQENVASFSCLPSFGNRHTSLIITTTSGMYEPFPTVGDFNSDGLNDIVITRLQFETDTTFPMDILINDGQGGMEMATSRIFTGPPPTVQHPSEVIVMDLNGDGRDDIFVANSGQDLDPFPGYQNALALSNSEGNLIDGTQFLPQKNDLSHSACAADIDRDGDIDIYVGNTWSQNGVDPYVLINNGLGEFSLSDKQLPPQLRLSHNGFRTCAFADVNNDGSPDLILGDVGEGISNTYSTQTSEILLNDGLGEFTHLPKALPAKVYNSSDTVHDIAPIHLNEDNYIDLLIVSERISDSAAYIQALINNGDGTFFEDSDSRLESFYNNIWPNWKATSGNPRRTLELLDADKDGDLDLLAKTWDSDNPEPILFLNDGKGTFIYKSLQYRMRGGDLYYTIIDLEGNGGRDILLTLNFPPDNVEIIRDLGCP